MATKTRKKTKDLSAGWKMDLVEDKKLVKAIGNVVMEYFDEL